MFQKTHVRLYFSIVIILVSTGFIFVAYRKLFLNQEGDHNIKQNRNTRIVIPKPIINVGKIQIDEPLKVAFEIINTGEVFLRIESVEADCHCTVADWQEEPIAPNDTTLIEVEYDTSNVGFFQQKISVYSNVEGSPKLLLLRGKVVF